MKAKGNKFKLLNYFLIFMFLFSSLGFTTKAEEAKNLTPIMGQAVLTKQQAFEYFRTRNKEKDLDYLNNFISIVWEEGSKEGIRPDIAFIQMMKETNFLKFTGDVKECQNNFAGIGAVGGGAQGNSFPDVRTGIRVVIQHLKAYASTESLVQECVDPRYKYVKKGISPYVNWLGRGENPNYPESGWATDPNYGKGIISMLNDANSIYTDDCRGVVKNLEVSLNGNVVTDGKLKQWEKYTVKSEAQSKYGVLYQFWVKNLKENSWTMIRDYSLENSTNWVPKESGKYLIGVHVKDKYSDKRLDNHRYDGYDVQAVKPEIKSLDVILNNQKIADTMLELGNNYSIKSSAVSPNGVLYQFWIKDLSKNKWTMIRDYSTSDNTTWSPKKSGKYLVGVHIKDKYSKERLDTHRYEDYFVKYIKGTVDNLEVTLNGAKVSDRKLAQGINYTIKSEGRSSNELLYQFWIKDLSKNKWTMIRDYSINNSVIWKPNKNGRYLVGVHVKDRYSKERLDDHKYDDYSVEFLKGTVDDLEVTLNGNVVSNGILESGRNYIIKSQGKSSNGVLYQFWIKDLSKNKWTMIRDYSVSNITTWKPNKSGKYLVGVHVKDKYSKNRLDNHRYVDYYVK